MQIQMKIHRVFGWIFSYFLAAEFSEFINWLEKICEFSDFAKIEMHFLVKFFVNKAIGYSRQIELICLTCQGM